jgi:hypothetical protein
MTQLSAKILARRTMIVCLMILIPATGIAIATAPQAESIRANVRTYVGPVLQHTAEVAATIPAAKLVKGLFHKGWKRV